MTPTLALLNFYIFVCLVCLIYQVTHKDDQGYDVVFTFYLPYQDLQESVLVWWTGELV